jgi:hypothetical protein
LYPGIAVYDTDRMATSEGWIRAIKDACTEPDPARSNHLITRMHFLLSEAIAERLGREGGPNFHSWAVWGSQKAGVTIRQEDLDNVVKNATLTAGLVGCFIGVMLAVICAHWFRWPAGYLNAAIGASIGALICSWAGRQLAIWSRAKASKLMLQGNRAVIEDIGEQSARFLALLVSGATSDGRGTFFAGLRAGPTERHGQDRLANAFRLYLAAYDSDDLEEKRSAMIAGNCEIVYHEHIRLEPYIRGAMPFVMRRTVTRWFMTYKIGERVLAVCEDVPGMPARTAARNWAKFEERMRYVFALFRKLHNAPEVFATPFSELEMVQIRTYVNASHV